MLVTNFAAPKLASALLEREVVLAKCAELLHEGRQEELQRVLGAYRLKPLPPKPPPKRPGSFRTPEELNDGPYDRTRLHPPIPRPRARVDCSRTSRPATWARAAGTLERLSRHLNRLPREYVGLGRRLERRASVVLPLCHHDGVPSIVFTRR